VSDVQDNTQFLLAAVTDTEGTIRATDTKASIALILHGLLFSGLVSVTGNVGHTYDHAGKGFQVAVVLLLGVAGTALLCSVLQLLLCVAPTPRSAVPKVDLAHTEDFFLPMRATGAVNPRVRSVDCGYAARVQAMDDGARLTQLTSEILKVSAIRARKTTLVRRGLLFLAVELGMAIAYLSVLGLHAA